MSDNVSIKFATLGKINQAEDWKDDTATLILHTEDGVDVKFDLNIMALAMMSLTLGPTLGALKARGEAAGDFIPPSPSAPDFPPEV